MDELYHAYAKTYYNLLLKNFPRFTALEKQIYKFVYRNQLKQGGLVDIFIDLNDMLSYLYTRPDYSCDDPMSIGSAIINLAAHMSSFFSSRMGIHARVYLIYGNTRPITAASVLQEYDAHNEMDRQTKPEITELIESNLAQVEVLVKYIPDLYFIRSNNAEPAVIIRSLTRVINQYDSKANAGSKPIIGKFVVTKDIYAFQLPATVPNMHIIRPKKDGFDDVSFTISYFDFFTKLTEEMKLKNLIGGGALSPELYSFYLAFNGCRARGIKSIYNSITSTQKLIELVNSGKILNGYNSIIALDPSIAETLGITQEVVERFKALDIIHQENIFRTNFVDSQLFAESLVNLYDPEAVKKINETYFRSYPLDLSVF